jgi:hypothetical protein
MTPDRLRRLASTDPEARESAFDDLCFSIYHQGSVYNSSVDAVPFLVKMADTEGFPDKPRVLELLSHLATGWSWHDSHKGMLVTQNMQNDPAYGYEAKRQRELGWVRELRNRVAAGLPVFLRLLRDPGADTRTAAGQLLLVQEASEVVREGALGAFAAEHDPVCRATLLRLAARHGADTLRLWDTGLATDPIRLVRLVAATEVLRKERRASPRAAADLVLAELREQNPELRDAFQQVPYSGEFVAALGGFLTFAGGDHAEPALRVLVEDVEARPDLMGERLQAMLALCCSHTDPPANVFEQPALLSDLAKRAVAAAFRSAVKDKVHYCNAQDAIAAFGIPVYQKARDEFLAAAGLRPWG